VTGSLTALLELHDNQRFARGMSTESKEFMRQRDAVMVRRLKPELRGEGVRKCLSFNALRLRFRLVAIPKFRSPIKIGPDHRPGVLCSSA